MKNKIERKRYELVLECATPVAHHAGNVGNHAHLMTSRFKTKDGWEDVPIVTADTMRHKLREASSWALLDAAGLHESCLTEAALRLLFNGGMVTGSDGGAVKLDAFRELVELVPSLGLFGGCAQNRIVPGRLTVEDAILICEETERFLSPWQAKVARELGNLDTFSAHVEDAQRVRMDATLDPVKRNLLTTGEHVKSVARLASSEAASEGKKAIEKAESKSAMLPRTFERIARGSLLAWAVEAVVQNELDTDFFHVSLLSFLSRAVVGGKSGTGHGQLRVVAVNEIKMLTASREHELVDTKALGLQVGKLFLNHVQERKDRVAEFLSKVAA